MSPRPVAGPATDPAVLRARVDDGNIAVLLMTVAHLTGDPGVLRPEGRPRVRFGSPALLPPAELEDARELCAKELSQLVADGVQAGPPTPEMIRAALDWIG